MQFEELRVWQSARELTNTIYDASDQGRFARDYGLRDQIRRGAVSIMSNIAEGAESRTNRLFIDYIGRAKASAGEVRAQLYVALDRGYITGEVFTAAHNQAKSISRQLFALSRALEARADAAILRETMVDYIVADAAPELDGSNPAP
jgi:four helix bundle protein